MVKNKTKNEKIRPRGRPRKPFDTAFIGTPHRKFRILIQERKSDGSKIERARSFMIYCFDKKVTIDDVKNKLSKNTKIVK
jgi:hypothetical protein